ncbi:MAG: glycosyltransferase [Clostridiales bacterium]|nr:glycosyltransferase [Clostridiales bacterium]
MHYSFVILHYQNAEVTRQCIGYINQLKNNDKIDIVIVDNASPNGSGKVLSDEFSNDDNIHFLLLERNIGFASGKNKGFAFAKNTLNSDVILVINSDLFVIDSFFLTKLENVITQNPEDSIIAPDIVSAYGGHQNPFMLEPHSSFVQHRIIARKRIGQLLYSIPVLNKKLVKRNAGSSTKKSLKMRPDEMLNIVPHGACVIYTQAWIKEEDIAFREGTFLFAEEEILYDYCVYKGYRIHYVPQLSAKHLEDASQNEDAGNALKKKKSQLRFEIQSRKVLLKFRNSYKR